MVRPIPSPKKVDLDKREPAIVVLDVAKVAYSNVPTPHEVDLSQQLLALQADRDVIEKRYEERILDLEMQLKQAAQREQDLLKREQLSHVDQIHAQNSAILEERAIWAGQLNEITAQLERQLHEKEAQKKWNARFIEHACSPSIHPLADDVFARFGQSIALLPSYESPNVVRAGCLNFLASILRETKTDAVLGPVLIGLIHLSIYKPPASMVNHLREEIVKAGTLPPLVHICEVVTNPAVLVEATRLMASLATCPLNKTAMAAKHAVRAIARLLTTFETQLDLYNAVLGFSLTALANMAHDSDILRSQIVNSGIVPCISRLLADSNDDDVCIAAAHALGNIGFSGTTNQGSVFMAQGDLELIKHLVRVKLSFQQPLHAQLIRHCAIALANLASIQVNQISIGYSETIPTILQLLVDATDPGILEACGLAIGSLCYQCKVNKVRVAAQNGIQVFLYVLSTPHRFINSPAVLVASALALTSLISMDGNLRQFEELDGHIPILALCMQSTDNSVIEACGKAIAAQAPTIEYKFNTVKQGKSFKIQEFGGVEALERVAAMVYSNIQPLPRWLQHGFDVMKANIKQMEMYISSIVIQDITNPKSDEAESVWEEVFSRHELALEYSIEIKPDPLGNDFYNVER